MISSRRADLISRSSKLQMYPDVWIGSWKFMKGIIKVISMKRVTQCNSRSWRLTSGSRFLKTYILVFSIMENRSGLSLAHFMSQTSLRSNLDGSPAGGWLLLASSEEAPASRSSRVITPAMSMTARRLKKTTFTLPSALHTGRTRPEREDSTPTSCCSWGTGGEVCCLKCISGSEPRLADCICVRCLIYAPANTQMLKFSRLWQSFSIKLEENMHVPLRGSYLWLSHSK